MGEPHPDPEALARWGDGIPAGEERSVLESHLASCAACRRSVPEDRAAPSAATAPSRRFRTWAAAAAVLLSVGVWGALREGSASRSHAVRAGRFTPAGGGDAQTFPVGASLSSPQGGVLVLDDGTEVGLDAAARVALSPPGAGERMHLRLEAGSIRCAVTRGGGEVVVSGGGGRVRVLGTVFRVTLSGGGENRTGVLGVAVEQGRVEVASEGGARVLAEGDRAYLCGACVPLVLAGGANPGDSWLPHLARRARDAAGRGDAEDLDLAVAMMKDHGEAAVEWVAARAADPAAGTDAERAAWLRILVLLDPVRGREAELPPQGEGE